MSESNAPPSRPGAPPRPRYGKQAARMAINRLKEVQKSDIHRVEGWRMVLEWIAEQSYGKKPVGMNLIASYTKEEAQ